MDAKPGKMSTTKELFMNSKTVHAEREKNKRSNDLPLLIKLEDAARMLTMSTRSIRRLSQAGTLPPLVKLGHSVRISYQGVLDYIEALSSGGKGLHA